MQLPALTVFILPVLVGRGLLVGVDMAVRCMLCAENDAHLNQHACFEREGTPGYTHASAAVISGDSQFPGNRASSLSRGRPFEQLRSEQYSLSSLGQNYTYVYRDRCRSLLHVNYMCMCRSLVDLKQHIVDL